MNFIRCLPAHLDAADEVVICSTRPDNKALFESPDSRIRLRRLAPFTLRLPALQRILAYLQYNLLALVYMIRFRPQVILYYETISAWVPWVLKRFFFRKAPLFIHYHEYMSPAEYAGGMFLNRYFHKLEKQLYPLAAQISHTNEYRMKLFRKDEGLADSPQLEILPNYPPESWRHAVPQTASRTGTGIIYVGSLNFKDFFLTEFINWVEQQNGQVYFDIYCLTDDFHLTEYLQEHGIRHTTFKGNAPYDQLPGIMRSYQIGVILYNSTAENTIYSAPNKLFEYAACGLDVWFPEALEGAKPYIRRDQWPRIIPVNFSRMSELQVSALTDRSGISYSPVDFYCATIYDGFIKKIFFKKTVE